jgi:uncharacterized membrane protein YfcA
MHWKKQLFAMIAGALIGSAAGNYLATRYHCEIAAWVEQ